MTTDIFMVCAILIATVVMLVLDVLRIDVVAILCMLALGWSGILEPREMLSGFSSNAVIAMMAVMIMGRGLAGTGIMDRFSRRLLARVGTSRSKIVGLMSLSVGVLSGFIQNIGAAALFLPGILDVSRRGKIPASALIMPIGFAAILGGTLSMVGSGPLILINDLLRSADLEPFGLLAVTPVGCLLLLSGIGYFFVFGRAVLPSIRASERGESEQEKLVRTLHLPHDIQHYVVSESSPLVDKTPEEAGLWKRYRVNILGISRGEEVEYAPWRETHFAVGQELALLGSRESIKEFAEENRLVDVADDGLLASLHDPTRSGFAEVIVPPRSGIVGKSIRQFGLRKRYAVEPVMLFSRGEEIRGDFSDQEIRPGDTVIVYGLWEKIEEMKAGLDFIVATPFQAERKDRSKTGIALLCFAFAIGLALVGFPISMAFFTGAMAMVLARVLDIQEAYQAIEWKVVFLLAGLIPLGVAMQKSGTAQFLAEQVMSLVSGRHPLWLVISVALLATIFSLFMSNVGAIVVLAPLVMSMAQIGGLDPRPLALMAAVCAANSFVLPTHQVNALLMSSGGYRNADYFKAGGGMTLVFWVVVVTVFSLFYL
ncbi:MAG: anion permease [Bradymonadales bacterium]|nr:anion permease [Bradymonadales bacterium]